VVCHWLCHRDCPLGAFPSQATGSAAHEFVTSQRSSVTKFELSGKMIGNLPPSYLTTFFAFSMWLSCVERTVDVP